MTTFTLTIKCDNAAFDEDRNLEIARILRNTASRLIGNYGTNSGTERDNNGNTVGKWTIKGGKK